jgi:Fe-S cluster assembly iron-binding protein IscA
MISISEIAKGALLESLRESGVPPDQGLRLKVVQKGLVLETGSPTEQDRVIRHQGSTVIIINEELEEVIGDAIIDVAQKEEGPQLVFQRISKNGH